MNFLKEAELLEKEIIETRRYLHAHPELSFQEENTTAFLEKELTKLGLEPRRFPDYFGVWADIHGAESGKTVLLRADIDALPLQEETGLPFASQTPGVMHACGHDNHAAMLLAAAGMLSRHRQEWKGTARVLFQAAEESCRGAEYYVRSGLLDDVDAVYGSHVWASLDSPFINIQSGPRMSSCDNFTITIEGKPAHGAMPSDGIDAITTAASVILQVQTIVSRRTDPRDSLTITIGEIAGGTRFNVIADRVVMRGTVRSHNSKVRRQVEERLRAIVEHVAAAGGASGHLEYEYCPDVLVNDPELAGIAKHAAAKLFGEDILKDHPAEMGSEDFSYYLEKAPGVYVLLGARNKEKGIDAPAHHPRFMVDESVLIRGAAMYAQFAFEYLGSRNV